MGSNKLYFGASISFILFCIIILAIPKAMKNDPEQITEVYIIKGYYENGVLIKNSTRTFIYDDNIVQHVCETWNNYADIYRLRLHLLFYCEEKPIKYNGIFGYILLELIMFSLFALVLVKLSNEYEWLIKWSLYVGLFFFMLTIYFDVASFESSRKMYDFSYSTSYNMVGSIYYGKYYNETHWVSDFNDQREFLHNFCSLRYNYPDTFYHNIYLDSCKIHDSYDNMKILNIVFKLASILMVIVSNVMLYVHSKHSSYDEL